MVNRPSAYDADGNGGMVLGQCEELVDVETGELLRRAVTLTFGKAVGRDAVRTPAVETITVARTGPAKARHIEARWLAGWLSAQKTRTLATAERQMLDVLVELAR